MYAIQTKKRSNSKSYDKIVFEAEEPKEIAEYMKTNSLIVVSKPYIFTHLVLNNGYIATCSFRGMICSPQKLADYLSANNI